MLSRILVPMDDSPQAEHALAYALEHHPEAAVTVLHVVGVPSMFMGEAVGLALEADLEGAAAERAAPVFERASAIAAEYDREIRTEVGLGHPGRNIVDRADAYETVVIGSHGAHAEGGTRRVLVGNVAGMVVRRAPVPVCVVR